MTPVVPTNSAYAAALHVISRLRQQHHIALLAGGCVRDRVMGLVPKDYDVATDAPPEVVRQLFARTQAVGEAFGVVLVYQGKIATEVATFRKEWGYQDGRRPDHVHYTDAREDVLRRDFTINGLLADPFPDGPPLQVVDHAAIQHRLTLPEGGQWCVLDYVGGLEDLRLRVLRAIGPAEQRFAEDYLRMLRAVRFASRFGFTLETRTAAAIRAHARYLGQISRERISQELRAMLIGPRPVLALSLLEQLHLDGPVLHEDHQKSRLVHVQALATMMAEQQAETRAAPAATAWILPLMAWVLDRHLPSPPSQERWQTYLRSNIEAWCAGSSHATLRRLRKALVLTNEDLQAWRAATHCLPTVLKWQEQTVAQKKRALASRGWGMAWTLIQSMIQEEASMRAWSGEVAAEVKALQEEGVAPPPLVNGDDLVALGRKPGPSFRRLLDMAYDLQLEGQLQTRAQALDWLATQKR